MKFANWGGFRPGKGPHIQAVPDFEVMTLAHDIAGVLAAFKWNQEIVVEAQTGVPPLFISDGIEVTYPKTGKLADAAGSLAQAFAIIGLKGPSRDVGLELRASGWGTTADGNPIMKSYPHFTPSRDTVVVLIGMKPIAVQFRPQLKWKLMGEPAWTKRIKSTGKFMYVKKSAKKFKGGAAAKRHAYLSVLSSSSMQVFRSVAEAFSF